MIAQSIERVREVFEAASAEDGAAREAILRLECDGDNELRAMVERMIAADAEPNALLDKPLAAVPPTFDGSVIEAGAMVGPYQIVRGIASGGMGAVYLARISEETAGTSVALKITRFSNALATMSLAIGLFKTTPSIKPRPVTASIGSPIASSPALK